jgi:hypothetical protein
LGVMQLGEGRLVLPLLKLDSMFPSVRPPLITNVTTSIWKIQLTLSNDKFFFNATFCINHYTQTRKSTIAFVFGDRGMDVKSI